MPGSASDAPPFIREGHNGCAPCSHSRQEEGAYSVQTHPHPAGLKFPEGGQTLKTRQHFAACPIIPTGTHMPLGTRLNIPQRLASHTVRSGARPLVRLCFKAAPAGGVTSSYPLPCPGPPHGIKGYKHPLTLSGSCFYHLEYQRFFAAHPPTFQPCATTVAFAFPPPAIPQQSRFPLPAGVAFG